MKVLILGPLNYEDARKDLILFNYKNKAYSIYYTLEGLIMHEIKKGRKLENQTQVAMFLASKMSENEYLKFDLFYGLVPKTYEFDMVVVYNKNVLEAQEAAVSHFYRPFEKEFYTSKDATHTYENIMEAIKGVERETAGSITH